MKKNWVLFERKSNNVFDQLLINRGVSEKEKESYLYPDFYNDLVNQKSLDGSDKFLERIKKAKQNKEKIGIFADYDADGIPGAAFLHKVLKLLKIDSETYIPTREEGYGLNKDGIDYLAKKCCTVIITVDLGIRNIIEVDYAKSLGLDIIITDHHEPGDTIPDAYAVINPKISESKEIFKELSGAGVVYKLAVEISKEFKDIDEKFLKWNLDLIAISTISDVVPLVHDNRVIAKFGLKVVNKTKNIGINKLIEISKIKKETITTYEVGFIIAPKINAPGRISKPIDSYYLLTTESENEASCKAKRLEEENIIRQEMMNVLIKEASHIIDQDNLANDNIIIISGDWQKGIIGPCASKLVEKYSRPVIVFSQEGDVFTGSARSINNINIIDLLTKSSRYLEKYGGHKGAAGLKLKLENYHKFVSSILKIATKSISNENLKKKYNIDLEIKFSQLNYTLYDKLLLMEPFGLGNKKPIFLSTNILVEKFSFIGNDKEHLSAVLIEKDVKIKSIYFNCPYKEIEFKSAKKINIIYYLENNIWNGQKSLQLHIIDIEFVR